MTELRIAADTAKLDEVQAFVESQLEEKGCPMKVMTRICVCVEEIFVNIADYAYRGGSGEAVVRVDFPGDGKTAELTFIDSGVPYDPLKKEDPDITLSAEEREVGGLGIFMVKQYMDGIEYAHVNGQNILTLRKVMA